jgi:hypothetical protein
LNEVLKVEVDVVVFCQGVEVSEIGVKEILGPESAKGCHDQIDEVNRDVEQINSMVCKTSCQTNATAGMWL